MAKKNAPEKADEKSVDDRMKETTERLTKESHARQLQKRPNAKPITEENNKKELEGWKKEAKKIETPAQLAEFVTKLSEGYAHDYGTIVHAIAAAMMAAMRVVDRGPSGGITGFQAGCVFWEVASDLLAIEGPARILQFRNMLYPQNADDFRTISKDTWSYVQEAAKKLLKEERAAHPDVIAHWKSLAAGQIPFGLRVSDR